MAAGLRNKTPSSPTNTARNYRNNTNYDRRSSEAGSSPGFTAKRLQDQHTNQPTINRQQLAQSSIQTLSAPCSRRSHFGAHQAVIAEFPLRKTREKAANWPPRPIFARGQFL
jgi:hypothetical protein